MLTPNTLERAKLTLDSFDTVSLLAEDTLNGNYSKFRKPAIFTRSLLWKMIVLKLNKVNSQRGHAEIELNLSNLAKLRKDYDGLQSEITIPWKDLDQHSEYYEKESDEEGFDITDDLNKKQALLKIKVFRDPLSSEDEETTTKNRKLTSQESDLQMLEAIITDVDRLFPEYSSYFIDNISNRKQMVRIVYLWCKLNDVSYYQGIHELCGVVYIVFYSERINCEAYIKKCIVRNKPLGRLDRQVLSLMDSNYVAHDTFSVFSILMKPIMTKYYSDSALLQETIMFDLKLHQCDKFLFHLFKNKFHLDSRLWLMRYFRLVLIREIGLQSSLQLWDRLIAFSFLQNPFQSDIDITLLLPYVIIIMMSLIKKKLIISDCGEALYLLLHYPVDCVKMKPSKESIILISDSEEEERKDTDRSIGDFTYIEENHQRHKLSGSSSLSGRPSSEETDSDTPKDTVKLKINEIVRDAIKLYQMGDSELEHKGTRLLESYSGMHNQQSRHGNLSTQVKRTASTATLMGMFEKANFWGKEENGSIGKAVQDLSSKLERMTIKAEEMEPKPQNSAKDFDRTRLEMRLKRRVRETLKKGQP